MTIEPFRDETQANSAGVRLASAERRRARPVLPPLLPDERVVTALCHLSTLVPLWAVPANALLFFLFRQSSRTICFHARQGIHYHFLFLLVAVPFLLLIPLENLLILAGVPRNAAETLPSVAFALLGVLYLVYATFCLVGVVQALRGRSYAYPLPFPLPRARQAPVYIRVSGGTPPSPQPESETEGSESWVPAVSPAEEREAGAQAEVPTDETRESEAEPDEEARNAGREDVARGETNVG